MTIASGLAAVSVVSSVGQIARLARGDRDRAGERVAEARGVRLQAIAESGAVGVRIVGDRQPPQPAVLGQVAEHHLRLALEARERREEIALPLRRHERRVREEDRHAGGAGVGDDVADRRAAEVHQREDVILVDHLAGHGQHVGGLAAAAAPLAPDEAPAVHATGGVGLLEGELEAEVLAVERKRADGGFQADLDRSLR